MGFAMRGPLCAAVIAAVAAGGIGLGEVRAASGMSFEQIMDSAAAAGPMQNGDGHIWTFRERSDGKWEVEGAQGNKAKVVEAGSDAVKIRGFPNNWGANGKFRFSADGGACMLKSDHGPHTLKWKC